MRFNILNSICILSMIFLLMTSCGPKSLNDNGNENVIGQKLEAMTPLRTSDGSQKQTIALFDEVIKKIHQFDLNLMSVDRVLPVLYPEQKHYVLHSGSSNYIVDLSEKHISIFDKNSVAQHEPITFQGVPKSAAFRPDLGWLVVYDDLQSVGVIKLASDGQVVDRHVFGSVVDGSNSIVSGDINDDGKLVLALSDNSIAIVDLATLMTTKHWSMVSQSTSLTKINWLAPVPGMAHRLLLKTNTQVVLYDLNTAAVLSLIDLNFSEVIKLSKSFNPHVAIATSPTEMKLIYTDGVTLLTRSFELVGGSHVDGQSQVYPILNSDLDLTNDTWTYVYLTGFAGYSLFNDVNQQKQSRHLVRFRVSDKLALQSKPVVDKAQIVLGVDFFFALYPSPLGKAEKFSIMSNESRVMEKFNLKQF